MVKVALAVLIGLAAMSSVHGRAAAQTIGNVQEVFSTAYKTPPTGARSPIAARAGVVTNERVETVSDAAVGLRFVDETRFRVGPDSNVVLDAYVFDPATTKGQATIAILRGSMRFVTGKMAKDGVRVATPSATIGVRGTDFAVIVHPGGIVDVAVYEGSVFLQPLQVSQPTVLVPGQYGRVEGPTSPVQVFGLPPSNRGGFIGIADIDRRIAGLRQLPAGPLQPGDLPFMNPLPAQPAQPTPPMQPATPQYPTGPIYHR